MKEIDPEKLRDMVRSILPSRYRCAPRKEKQQRKRAHRRGVRADLRSEDPETTAADLLRDVCVTDIVVWRRLGDKLNHFLRWCEAITAGMTVDEALGFVRGIVPRGVIGDHAYDHWEWHRKPWFPTGFTRKRFDAAQSYRDSCTARLTRAFDEDPTLHGRLNAEIKRRKPEGEPRRLLFGRHDIATFVADIGVPQHTLERRVLLELIEQHKKGGREGRPSRLWDSLRRRERKCGLAAAIEFRQWSRRRGPRRSDGCAHSLRGAGALTGWKRRRLRRRSARLERRPFGRPSRDVTTSASYEQPLVLPQLRHL